MGITTSRESRRCGLCYFSLKEDALFLHEPLVKRRAMPGGSWAEGRLDDPLYPPYSCMFVQLGTTLLVLQTSIGRGCIGCAAIWEGIADQLRDRGFALDERSMREQCQLIWLVGNRSSSSPSLQVELMDTSGDIHRKEILTMILGYRALKNSVYWTSIVIL